MGRTPMCAAMLLLCAAAVSGNQIVFGPERSCVWTARMNSLVAAYEQLGGLEAQYTRGSSVWGLTTTNPTVTTHWSEYETNDYCVGVYKGFTDFYSFRAGEGYKRLSVTLNAGVGAMTVDVVVERGAPPLTTGFPAQLVTQSGSPLDLEAYAVNCESSTPNKGACSLWTLFGLLYDKYSYLAGNTGYARLQTKLASLQELVDLLRYNTVWGKVWNDDEVAAVESYYADAAANGGNVVTKFLHYGDDHWDTAGIVAFVYNEATRLLLVIKKLKHST